MRSRHPPIPDISSPPPAVAWWPDATACLKHISTLWFETWFEVPHQGMPALLSGARRPVNPPVGWPPASSTATEEAITTDAEAVTPMEAGAINATEADATAVEAGKYRYGSYKSKPKPYQADVEAALEAVAATAAETKAEPQPKHEPEHAAGAVGLCPRESHSSYQRLPTEEGEIEALRAAVSTLEAKMSAQEANMSAQEANMSALKGTPKKRISTATSVDNLEEGPPLLQLCVGGGCIQKTSAELSGSVYFISLLRIISLLKATKPPANARSRLAAAGWASLLFIAAMFQIFLMVLILETSTSSTCSVEHQTGCRSGEYCSFSIAKGQCNDCSVILPDTTTCCPTMNATCPVENFPYDNNPYGIENNTYSFSGHPLCSNGCPHACIMYNHCMSQESNEHDPRRCDFLVNSRGGVKWSHIFLLIFGAVLWTSDLISVLDETDMMAATLPEAETGEERSTHNAIVVLFKFIFVLRTCVLPALSAAGAVVAILTDNDGNSLTGGAPAAVEPEIISARLYHSCALPFASHRCHCALFVCRAPFCCAPGRVVRQDRCGARNYETVQGRPR